jgi:hypothetical protein
MPRYIKRLAYRIGCTTVPIDELRKAFYLLGKIGRDISPSGLPLLIVSHPASSRAVSVIATN